MAQRPKTLLLRRSATEEVPFPPVSMVGRPKSQLLSNRSPRAPLGEKRFFDFSSVPFPPSDVSRLQNLTFRRNPATVLAEVLEKRIRSGPLTATERRTAGQVFTKLKSGGAPIPSESARRLLDVLRKKKPTR